MLTLLSKPAIQQKDFEMMDINQEKGYLCVLNFDEVNVASQYLPISEELLYQSQNIRTSKFESHEGFDFITLNTPILFFVDTFCSLFNNSLWFKMRNISHDIVIDRHGNILPLDEIAEQRC